MLAHGAMFCDAVSSPILKSYQYVIYMAQFKKFNIDKGKIALFIYHFIYSAIISFKKNYIAIEPLHTLSLC